MDQFEKEIEEKIFNLSKEFIILLRKNGFTEFLKIGNGSHYDVLASKYV